MATQKFTAEQVAKVLRDSRGLVSIAAQKLDCSPQTVRNYMARYTSVQQEVHEAREKLVDIAEIRFIEAIERRSEPWAIAMALKTLGKHRGYVEKTLTEQSGPNGGPIEYRDVGTATDSELERLAGGTASRRRTPETETGEDES